MSPADPCPCPTDGLVPTIGYVDVNVNECWAVDRHWRGTERTPVGELVHQAKTYAQGKAGSRTHAERLARCLGWWARHLTDVPISRMELCDVVCAIPANPARRPFNLPDVLAEGVAEALGAPLSLQLLQKVRPTPQIKYTATKGEKESLLRGVFAVDGPVPGTVLVIDDLVLSGATLEAAALALREAGAERVIALVATHATKGLMG